MCIIMYNESINFVSLFFSKKLILEVFIMDMNPTKIKTLGFGIEIIFFNFARPFVPFEYLVL